MVRWFVRMFQGPFGAVIEQAAAQPAAPTSLPALVTIEGGELTLRFLEQRSRVGTKRPSRGTRGWIAKAFEAGLAGGG